jgi:integrase/recombinase XerC
MTDQNQTEITALLPEFRRALEENDRRPRTITGYLSDLTQFVAWWQQQYDSPPTLPAITAHDVRDYRDHLQQVEQLSPPTVNRRLASLRVLLTWAVDTGRLAHNPAARIRGIKLAARTVPRWLSRAEQQRLVNAFDRTVQLAMTLADHPAAGLAVQAVRDRALLVLLLNTGLRVLEVVSLTLDDVTLNGRSGAVFVRDGKGGKARTIPLNGRTRELLDEYLALRPAHSSRRLFVGQRGPIGSRQVLRLLKKYSRHAGLAAAEISVHTLRHTFGKNLVDAGVPLDQVATLMGHANLNTTRIYTTPGRRDLQRAVERLG